MEKAIKYCKVCGAPYEYCHTNRPTTIFRWQDVACSREHGDIYFAEIAKSRGHVLDESVAAILVGANSDADTTGTQQEIEPAAPKRYKAKKRIATEDTVTD